MIQFWLFKHFNDLLYFHNQLSPFFQEKWINNEGESTTVVVNAKEMLKFDKNSSSERV